MCSNKEIVCHVEEHSAKTHGIDALFAYNSPLQKQTLISVVVSAKYSSNPYTNIRPTFKSHFKDIANAIDCYSKSHLKRNLTKEFDGSSRKTDVGVLFYINNIDDETKNNIKPVISTARLDGNLNFNTIHVVDNERADFLFSALGYIKKEYANAQFFCHGTTLNIGSSKSHSKIMPVEYVTSPIIPLSVELDGRRRFIFLCDFNFSRESLQLILKLAKKLCADFSSHYEIYFKNYNNLTDTPVVDEVKMTLLHEEDDAEYPQSSQDIKITVDTYKSDFRSNKHE